MGYKFVTECSVNGQYTSTEHTTPEEAIAVVEEVGKGRVIEFLVQRNMPGCLPEFVDKSLNMWSLGDGEWWSHYIYDGHGGKLERERPHY